VSFSIRMKLLMSGLGSLLIAIVIGVTGYVGISQVDNAMDTIVEHSKGVVHHQTADMMHDSLRSDVYAALVASLSGDLSQKEEVLKDFDEHANTFKEALEKNKKLALRGELMSALGKADNPLRNYIASAQRIIDLAFVDSQQALQQLPAFKQDFDRLAVEMETLTHMFESDTADAQKGGDSAVDDSKMIIVSISILAAFILIISSMILSKRITGPLDRAVRVAKRIAEGKLENEFRIDTRDETGQLLESLQAMSESLTSIVSEVVASSTSIAEASSEIALGNASLSQRTEEQASSLEETASSMEEMTGTVKQNAGSASEAKQLADANRQRAANGAEVVHRTVQAMNEINASSTRIADIIGTIDGIAFQTNLLALNAAVEAARAGEQGRGFAVVASEVRSLAQRSAEAAKEIKTLIEDSVGKVKVGTELVDKSGKTLEEIIEGTQKVADIIAEIAASSQEQASGIDQVNNAVTQMDTMTQDNAALVEESAAASRALEEQTANLRQQMSFFNLGNRAIASSGPMAARRLDGYGHVQPTRQATDRTHLEHLQQARAKPTKDDSSDWEQF